MDMEEEKEKKEARFSLGFGKTFWLSLLIIFLSSLFGFFGGVASEFLFNPQAKDFFLKIFQQKVVGNQKTPSKNSQKNYLPRTYQEKTVIDVVKKASPAVVSIIITKDLPVFEEYYVNPFKEFEQFFGPGFFEFKVPQFRKKGTEKKEIGGGTGFIISKDGMVVTNAHVVSDKSADYTILTNDGKKYPAKVLARDSLRDIAILKIQKKGDFPVLQLGDSDNLQIGQTVIAIGNALGEFRNTVSVGVISGLGRRVTASGGGTVETLEDVIQTDAAINRGNSGGPLLNLEGKVVGVNFAMAEGAQNIGFAIPINRVKRDIEQVKTTGKIVYAFLGVRYRLVDKEVQEKNHLPVDYGAWIVKGPHGEPAVIPGSPAENAGLQEGDVILELDGQKITPKNSLAKLILKHKPGDRVALKILRNDKELKISVVLGQRKG